MTTGICYSTYHPLLRGELDLIMQAKKECDRCVVIAPAEAAEALRTLLGEQDVVRVVEAHSQDAQEIRNIAQQETGESEAVWYLHPRFSSLAEGGKAVYGGENSALHHREAETEGACKRVLITGWASEGKSTLARDVAAYWSIPYVPEAARVYMEDRHLKDEELTEEDFLQFIRLQNRLTDEAKDRAAIVDTCNVTTLAYTISYADDPDVTAITEESIARIREEVRIYDWARIYVLPPKNAYVDDGLRYMKQADLDVRFANFALLLRLLAEYGLKDRIVFLTGNYYENYKAVRDYVGTLLQ